MRVLILFMLMLFVCSCTQQPYSGIDNPSDDRSIVDETVIKYIDKRLEQEYYWLDEVKEKRAMFNRNMSWNKYLNHALSKLTTNVDDGSYDGMGQYSYYSFIRDVSRTRAGFSGFGILLHYTIIIIGDSNRYGFVVESVYPDSPAYRAGIKRGDIILKIDGSFIDNSNYITHFSNIQQDRLTSINLTFFRRTEDNAQYEVTLEQDVYDKTPIAHYEVIDVEGYDKRIGYLTYLGFEKEYDDKLIEVFTYFVSEGVEELILDLRCNGGGSLSSARLLCSAFVPSSYEDKVLGVFERNKNNKVSPQKSELKLQDTGQYLSLERLTVLCSGYSASSSEVVVMGLRGLDFPVKLIGSLTEGKNCGMDISYKIVNSMTLEYAPITFMFSDAKGFGDWGDGIIPDIDLTYKGNASGVYDLYYPLPYADWGDSTRDIALAVALADITGKSVAYEVDTRSDADADIAIATSVAHPVVGARLYEGDI